MKPKPIEPEGFDAFWTLQLRKESKLDALKAWNAMTREHAPADILAGYVRLLPSERKKDRKFQKLPATWLRAGCWMDETPPDENAHVSRYSNSEPLDLSKLPKSKFLQQFETSH
jgi:hypothetical protein